MHLTPLYNQASWVFCSQLIWPLFYSSSHDLTFLSAQGMTFSNLFYFLYWHGFLAPFYINGCLSFWESEKSYESICHIGNFLGHWNLSSNAFFELDLQDSDGTRREPTQSYSLTPTYMPGYIPHSQHAK